MYENNYSLAHTYTQQYHAWWAIHKNQTLGNMFYSHVNNNVSMHYVLNAITKPFGKNGNYSFNQTNLDVLFSWTWVQSTIAP